MTAPGLRRARILLSALALVAEPALGGAQTKLDRALDDGHGAYATGRYRDLFGEAGHSKKEIDAKVEAAYRQLFHGSSTT